MIFPEYIVRNPPIQFSHIGQDIIVSLSIRHRYTNEQIGNQFTGQSLQN